ncbi:MAG: metallophosphoesterase family protein, partial [Fervidicoccaceae archaeon]
MNAWEIARENMERELSSPSRISRALEEYASFIKESYRERIVRREHRGTAVFVGDIHGDLDSLSKILSRIDASLLDSGETQIFFLGDYIDRGPNQLECLFSVLELISHFPKSTVALRGNHEPLPSVTPYPHDFPAELNMRFGYERGSEIYNAARQLFDSLPFVFILNSEIIGVHGGLPTKNYMRAESLEEFLIGHGDQDFFDLAVELLWNDPIDDPIVRLPSPRGAGYLWGTLVTDWAKKSFSIGLIVRGHEPSDYGYKLQHNGTVLTLFSRMGPPY